MTYLNILLIQLFKYIYCELDIACNCCTKAFFTASAVFGGEILYQFVYFCTLNNKNVFNNIQCEKYDKDSNCVT